MSAIPWPWTSPWKWDAVTEQLTVTAESPLLETAKADRGTLVDQQTVAEMPLNGRNPFMLAKITAGVNFNGTVIYQRPFDNGAIAQSTRASATIASTSSRVA